MTTFLGSITGMLSGAPTLAMGGAFLWGLFSVLFSPCHLISVPLIVGYLNDRKRISQIRAFVLSLLFALGILVTIAGIGLVTAQMGKMLGDIGVLGDYIVGGLLVLFGLYLTGLVPLLPTYTAAVDRVRGRGMGPAFLMGLVFGVGLGPCTFAFMAPVLAVVLAMVSEKAGFAAVLLAAFGIGHCLVIVVAGTFTEVVRGFLNWDNRSRGAMWVKRCCGALVAAGGIYMIAT